MRKYTRGMLAKRGIRTVADLKANLSAFPDVNTIRLLDILGFEIGKSVNVDGAMAFEARLNREKRVLEVIVAAR